MYYNGEGVSQDYKQAVEWWVKAAEQGLVKVQFNLGAMYYNGEGVSQDYKQVVEWWVKAAEQGHVNAQFNLGVMYFNGKRIPQNYKLAYVWNNLAAAQGKDSAINNRDFFAKALSPKQLNEAQDLASKIQYKIDNPTK